VANVVHTKPLIKSFYTSNVKKPVRQQFPVLIIASSQQNRSAYILKNSHNNIIKRICVLPELKKMLLAGLLVFFKKIRQKMVLFTSVITNLND
jgi:hypothetical protein